ncbi:hypothetical protein GCM10028786_23170 [Flaviaesturariibacter terrae]
MVPLDSIQIGADEQGHFDSDIEDSLRLVPVFDSALAFAQRHPPTRFRHRYSAITADSLWNVTVSLHQSHLFVAGKTHLQVTVSIPGSVRVRFYEREGEHLRLLLATGTDDPVSDTLRDVNGDAVNDFLLSDYSSAGCCPRERYHVWCYGPSTHRLGPEQEFFNATFLPAQHTILGFGYGHPGDVEVYTLRWHGTATDTAEYGEPIGDRPGYFRMMTRQANGSFAEHQRKGLPLAYRSMKGYDWVIDSPDDGAGKTRR